MYLRKFGFAEACTQMQDSRHNPCRDVSHFAVTLGHPRWMSDAEEDKLRAVLETWIMETPQDYEMTRLELREHPNEITVGSQTGMRKGNRYVLTWPDINFKLRLITLPDTKTGGAAYRSDDGSRRTHVEYQETSGCAGLGQGAHQICDAHLTRLRRPDA
jgi:hypothetical protein